AGDRSALDHQVRFHAKEGRRPQHEIGQFADLHGADFSREPLRDGGIDRVFGDVALDPRIVVTLAVSRQWAALDLHLVRGLPGTDDDLAHAAHRLAVGRHHRQRADVVQDVLGCDRFLADTAFGKGHVLRYRAVQVMADHQHVQVLVQRIRRVGTCGFGGARQHVGQARDLDDIWRMAAAGALGVKRVDGAALERGDRVLHEAGLVQRVRVYHHLHVEPVRHRQAGVDGSGRGAPVLVQLQAGRAGTDHFLQCLRLARVAFAGKGQVDRQPLRRLQHTSKMPGTRGAGGGGGAGGRACTAADHGGDAGRDRVVYLLRADEMDVAVDPAGREYLAFTRNDLGAWADDDIDIRLHIGIAGLADPGDAPV